MWSPVRTYTPASTTRKPFTIFLMRIAVLALCCHFFVSSSAPSAKVLAASNSERNSQTKRTVSRATYVDDLKPKSCNATESPSITPASMSEPTLVSRGGQLIEPPTGESPTIHPTEISTEDDTEEDERLADDDDDQYFDEFEESSEIIASLDTKQRNRFLKHKKLKFLNRIAEVSSNLLKKEHDAILDKEGTKGRYSTGLEFDVGEEDDDRITKQSDLTRPGRYIHIVTTASLPWMTGTAVNPLLRAAYLHERLESINNAANTTRTSKSFVTLVIPWLELQEDQKQVYNGRFFESKADQELFVREWLATSANMLDAAQNLKIVFYNARYHSGLGSVFAMGDILRELPEDELDVCVLEEPEHLNWFRAPSMESWTKRYNYVVGIVHTNYDQYATQHYSGLWTAPAIRLMSAAMVRAYCHKVIKLSAVVQDFAPEKEVISNVHGVRTEFIARVPTLVPVEDTKNTGTSTSQNTTAETQVYFIGKLLWTKGLDILLEYQEYYKDIVGAYFPIDIYGSGPDQSEISRAYLGRQKVNGHTTKKKRKTSATKKAPKNTLFRALSWMKKRKHNKKRSNRTMTEDNSSNSDSEEEIEAPSKSTMTAEEIYKEVMDVMESLPLKARESIEGIPAQLKVSLDQLSEDAVKAQENFKGLPAKARKALNQLIDDLSSRATTFPLPRSLYEFRRQSIPANFPGRVDHAILKGNTTNLSSYKVFVNPSVSEVLCTTTAEALAMGKFAIIPVHPSNKFFLRFPNCLGYRNPYEFVANLRWALTHDPAPHTEEFAREFTWEAATDRFLEASSITHFEARQRELLGKSKIDERIAWLHNEIGKGVKGDLLRKALGAGPVSGQVKYELTRQKNGTMDEDDIDVGEGMPFKFRNSVFVRSLREAIESGLTISIDG